MVKLDFLLKSHQKMHSTFNPLDCESGKFNLCCGAISIGKRDAGSRVQLVQ